MKLDPVEEHRRKQRRTDRRIALWGGSIWIIVLAIYYQNPAPPGSDLMFKIGWFFGNLSGWFTNLFR